jgi:hypothetical protein
MSADPAQLIWRKQRLRADFPIGGPADDGEGNDRTTPEPFPVARWVAGGLAVACALLFVVLGGGSQDLGPAEARAGMASAGPVAPLGQVYGSWDPQLLPGRVLPAKLWTALAGEQAPTTDSIRWPAAIWAVALGLVLSAQANRVLGPRGGVTVALATFGSLLFLDRSAVGLGLLDAWFGTALHGLTGSSFLLLKPIAPEVDFLAGLATTAALGRALTGRADRSAGIWAALAFLAGGWPALAAIAIPVAAVRKFAGEDGGWKWLWPAGVAVIGWSAWCWTAARPEAWFATMLRPVTRPLALTMPLWALVYSLPLGPLAVLTVSPRVRASWSRPGRVWIARWAQGAGVLAVAGIALPGLGDAVRIPLVCGLAILAGAALDGLAGAWEMVGPKARRWFLGLSGLVVIPTIGVGIPMAVYLAAAVPYYRPAAIALIIVLSATGLAWMAGAGFGLRRAALGSLVGLVLAWKVAYGGMHVPEWNYRASQGPWGRAIGQWMPRSSTLYFINPSAFDPSIPPRDRWPADLAFYTGRKVRQIASPGALDMEASKSPRFVLLHPTELEHWPVEAPRVIKVRDLQDAFGSPRVLVRTEGPLYPDRRKELGE